MPWNYTNEPPWKATEIKGFWRVTTDRGDPGDEYDVDSSGDKEVADLGAAAPALRDALIRYRTRHEQQRWPHHCRCEICRQADEAIKAAEGQQ